MLHHLDLFSRRSMTRSKRQPERLQTHYSNQQCSFFSKLPLEVRMMIYECVITDWCPCLHIVMILKNTNYPTLQLAASPSSRLPFVLLDPKETQGRIEQWMYKRPSYFGKGMWGLQLMLSSRQMYHETIDLIYSTLKFTFLSSDTLHRFLRLTPPESLLHITALEARLTIPYAYQPNPRLRLTKTEFEQQMQYLQIWDFLHQMKAMRTLWIEMMPLSSLGYDILEEGLFGVMTGMKHLKQKSSQGEGLIVKYYGLDVSPRLSKLRYLVWKDIRPDEKVKELVQARESRGEVRKEVLPYTCLKNKLRPRVKKDLQGGWNFSLWVQKEVLPQRELNLGPS